MLKSLDPECRSHLLLFNRVTASKRRLSFSVQITIKRVLRPLGSRSIHKPALNVLFPQASWWCLAHSGLPLGSSDILVYFSPSFYPFQLPSPTPWDRFLNTNPYNFTWANEALNETGAGLPYSQEGTPSMRLESHSCVLWSQNRAWLTSSPMGFGMGTVAPEDWYVITALWKRIVSISRKGTWDTNKRRFQHI